MRRLLAMAAAVLLAGCPLAQPDDDDDDATEPPTPDPPALTFEGNVPGEPDRLDFGAVEVGQTGLAELRLANTGGDDLLLSPPELSGEASFSIGSAWPSLLAPGEERAVAVAFTPSDDGPDSGHLRFDSNDPAVFGVEVLCVGDGLAPRLAVSPDPVSFGDVALFCAEASETLNVLNVGRAPLTVLGAELDVFADPAEIHLLETLEELVLQPEEFVALSLRFAPTVEGPQTGLLTLSSDDPTAPELGVTVAGAGVWPPVQTDAWLAGTPMALDILWVIDNSSSVGDEQSTFAVNLVQWFDEQLGSGLVPDWQMAVITTDIGDGGAFQAPWGQPVLSPTVPGAAEQFSANANLGTSGSGIEQGFYSVLLALDPAGPNPAFLRPQAALSILFLSDEAEQSGWLAGPTPEDRIAAILAFKADPARVVLSAVSGGPAGCSGPGGNASAGADFSLAASITGGLDLSICDPNWAAGFQDTAWRPWSLVQEFPPSSLPVVASLEVRVEGVPLPAGTWSWDAARALVVIAPEQEPDAGDLVEISYVAESTCSP
jgi:hypothetical protein